MVHKIKTGRDVTVLMATTLDRFFIFKNQIAMSIQIVWAMTTSILLFPFFSIKNNVPIIIIDQFMTLSSGTRPNTVTRDVSLVSRDSVAVKFNTAN